MKDWVAWHAGYDNPASSLVVRLQLVCGHLARALGQAPAGPVRLVSLCAGQGRDVLSVLPGHPRREDVSAVLVETDPDNAAQARQRAAEAGLARVEVREADAGMVATFADVLPADVLLLCGIFGNISDRDIQRTIEAAPALCAPGATVLWTRHRREPDLTPRIREWFTASGFEEIAFDAPDTETRLSVGASRLASPRPAHLPPGPLFTFRHP